MVAIVGPSRLAASRPCCRCWACSTPPTREHRRRRQRAGSLSAKERTQFRARQVGFIFQQFNLIPNLSALENVLLALEYAGWPKADRERPGRGDALPGGPRRLQARAASREALRRRAAARGDRPAFAAQPPLILADEPTGSLDRATGQKIVQLLREAATSQQATVLVVTHDDRVAAQADRRFVIEDGVLTEQP